MFLRGHCKHLKSRGYDVQVIASGGAALNRFDLQEQIPTTPVKMNRRLSPLADVCSLFELYRALRRLRPEVVHCHTPKQARWAPWPRGSPGFRSLRCPYSAYRR